MGRLVAGVREAEERLAGLARALQSLYEEEVREATLARDAAGRSLSRAQAMEHASHSLGQDDLTKRLVEVMEQLRTAFNAATKRLEELAGIEKAVQLRLHDSDSTPPATALLPAAPASDSLAAVDITVATQTPPPAPVVKEDDLLTKQKQLLARIEEIERSAAKWPKEIARLAMQEHVALARLMAKRFDELHRADEDLVTAAVARMSALAIELKLEKIIGFESTDSGDWNKIALTARTERTNLVEARKKAATKSA